MARQPRFAVAGLPHLVVQRGDPARPAFVDDTDRRRYVELLGEVARVSPVAVHAFGLTDEEIGLLVTPSQPEALGRFMQRVGRRYVAEFHARHGGRGPLWPGRSPVPPSLPGPAPVRHTTPLEASSVPGR